MEEEDDNRLNPLVNIFRRAKIKILNIYPSNLFVDPLLLFKFIYCIVGEIGKRFCNLEDMTYSFHQRINIFCEEAIRQIAVYAIIFRFQIVYMFPAFIESLRCRKKTLITNNRIIFFEFRILYYLYILIYIIKNSLSYILKQFCWPTYASGTEHTSAWLQVKIVSTMIGFLSTWIHVSSHICFIWSLIG